MELSDDEIYAEVQKILEPMNLKIEDYEKIRDKIIDAMEQKGQFLALDLGGTNYRVLLVTLAGGCQHPKIDERTYAIPQKNMLGTSKEHALNKSILVRWTKGFNVKDAVHSDVAELLQRATDEIGLKVKCVAVVNDTVGTLASCALEDPRCAIGLIVGTGTNAAYIEKIEASEFMKKMESKNPVKRPKEEDSVIINLEWGAFGEKDELKPYLTDFDIELDHNSLHPGKQIYEKMVSGMYLGELVRIILMNLVKRRLLFRGEMPDQLLHQGGFLTKMITETERDPPHLFYSTHSVLTEDLKLPIVDPIDDRVVRLACECVSKRAAYLAGAGISALMHRLNRPQVTVGIDGSLYKFHPRFRERMTDIIDKLKPDFVHFRLRLSEDGSGKGAAAIAAAATRPTNPIVACARL
ncbi:Hexokinase [Taenia crassiceps]|uniref:Phosphotransferase n=1 Tax=Taenia crassiceps TaxID=6207 RepID=A0ABR4QTR8_9CEST